MSKATEFIVLALLGFSLGTTLGCEFTLLNTKHELQVIHKSLTQCKLNHD